MAKWVIWTKSTLEAFIIEGNLNERQEFIVRSRASGYTIARQAYELHLSVDQINKEIAKLKKIYDVVQKQSATFPKGIQINSEIN